MRISVRVLPLVAVLLACASTPIPSEPGPTGVTGPTATSGSPLASESPGSAPTPVVPTPTETLTTSQPSATPAPEPTAGVTAGPSAVPSGQAGGPPLVGEDEAGFPGLFLPAGITLRGNDHAATIVSDLDCEELAAVIGAGEWTQAGAARIPAFDAAGSPQPDEPPTAIWMLFERGDEALVAKIAGTPCSGRLARTSSERLEVTGWLETSGTSQMSQELCLVGEGTVQFGGVYLGPGDVGAGIGAEVPLRLGQVEAIEAGVEIGHTTITRRSMFEALARRIASGQGVSDEEPVGTSFDVDPSRSSAVAEITSIDPLVGTLTLTELVSEAGDALSLTAGFRCDLAPGRLTRAASATPRPTPTPTPEAPPGLVRVEIASGPFEGTHEVRPTGELACSEGVLRATHYDIYYAPSDPSAVFTAFFLGVPREGASAGTDAVSMSIFFTRDDDFGTYTIDSERGLGSGTARVSVVEGRTTFTVAGKASDGTAVEAVVECGRMDQPEP